MSMTVTLPKVENNAPPVLDRDVVESLRADLGAERLGDIIATACVSLTELGQRLEQAWQVGDMNGIGRSAHMLKSSASALGCAALRLHALGLERATKAGNITKMEGLMKGAPQVFQRTLAALSCVPLNRMPQLGCRPNSPGE
ncbi:hypothetical protein WCLP8_4570002 [uncultured Gammaproteobacteria bacterium]